MSNSLDKFFMEKPSYHNLLSLHVEICRLFSCRFNLSLFKFLCNMTFVHKNMWKNVDKYVDKNYNLFYINMYTVNKIIHRFPGGRNLANDSWYIPMKRSKFDRLYEFFQKGRGVKDVRKI